MAKILVIDDDPEIAEYIRMCLHNDYEVKLATCGEDGLALFKASAFALIITDIVMPNKDGLEVVREISNISPETPILVISSGLEGLPVDLLQTAMDFGADLSIQKPFKPEQLEEAVKQLLS